MRSVATTVDLGIQWVHVGTAQPSKIHLDALVEVRADLRVEKLPWFEEVLWTRYSVFGNSLELQQMASVTFDVVWGYVREVSPFLWVHQVGRNIRNGCEGWHRRGVRPVVTIEPFDQDRQQLLDTIAKLDRRARVLAAVVRILLALLRASGFSLAGGQRLPEGNAKAGILDLPAQLAAARSKAREERLAANRAMSCNQCIGQQASLPASLIPP